MNTGANPNKSLWSVDSMVFRTATDGICPPPQTIMEEQERFTLWASCLVFDTYSSMESGRPFALDERHYPEFIIGWRPRTFYKKIIVHPRSPTMATHTVWENGPFADMFDQVSDICTSDLHPSSNSSNFNLVVWICVIIRRILRIVRCRVPICTKSNFNENWWNQSIEMLPCSVKNAFMQLPRNVSVSDLNDSLLMWHSNLPNATLIFPSLEMFVTSGYKPEFRENEYWKKSAPTLEGTLLYLCAFCYLHMASLDSSESNEKMYKLSAPRFGDVSSIKSTELRLFSSRQILLAALRAVSFILQEILGDAIRIGAPTASPIQYWAIQPLELFIISSSGLLATRVSPFDQADFNEAIEMVQNVILPSITLLCSFWPVASHYKAKLETLILNVKLSN
jgi:hypothetical protein